MRIGRGVTAVMTGDQSGAAVATTAVMPTTMPDRTLDLAHGSLIASELLDHWDQVQAE